MKRIFILLTVALLSVMSTNLDAKVVRGYVTDPSGRPVQGVKMVVVCEDVSTKPCYASTDAEGFFSVTVPDEMDTAGFARVLSKNGTRVISHQETGRTVWITIEPKQTPDLSGRRLADRSEVR